MELKEIMETLQKAETKIKVQEEAIKHYKEDVKELEKQITEKDKKIEELHSYGYMLAMTLKQSRKYFGEEIREIIQQYCSWNNQSKHWYIEENKIEELLDKILIKIEQGE